MPILKRLSGSNEKHLATTHFDAYQDGALTEAQTATYRQHLAICHECQAWVDNQMRISQQLRSEASPPATLSPAAAARIQQNIYSRMRRAMIMNNVKSFVGATVVLALLAVVVGNFVWQSRNLEPVETEGQPALQLETVEGTLDDQLVEAVVANDAAAVKRLLEAGANPDVVDSAGNPIWKSALLGVQISGKPDIVGLLIEYGADPNGLDINGDAFLPQAAEMGQLEVVQLLLDAGADVNATMAFGEGDKRFENATSLMGAASANHIEIVALLIAHGAEVNQVDSIYQRSALHTAAWENSVESVQILIDNGADLNRRSTFSGGQTPLHFAAFNSAVEAVQVLIAAGADVDIQTEAGLTPLMNSLNWGFRNNLSEIVTALLAGGANPNLQDGDGNTALHYASSKGWADPIPILIEYGAALDVMNNNGDTPLDVAETGEIAELLREARGEK